MDREWGFKMTEPVITRETSQTVPTTDTSRRTKGFIGPAILFLLVFGVAGSGSYFFGWPFVVEQWHRFADLERELKDVRAVLEQSADVSAAASAASEARARSLLEAARRDSEQTLRRLQDAIDVEVADAQSQSTLRIGRLEQQVDRLLAVDRRAWLGQEAAFLLRLASQRLLVARDIDAAMALLAQADELLRATDAPAYEPVRMAIAEDHANLAAIPTVDEVGLYARLAALIDQVEQLQLAYERPPVATEDQMAAEQTVVDQNWLDGIESSWYQAISKLSAYLVIRRSNDEIAALMTPEWSALARQNLRMLLEQSQIAMLTANASLYEQSLLRSERFTTLFSQYDPDRVQGILEEIRALQGYEIAPQLPDMVLTRHLLDSELERLGKQMAP
jgi:uroporphyrin-3 C-methyltransferase